MTKATSCQTSLDRISDSGRRTIPLSPFQPTQINSHYVCVLFGHPSCSGSVLFLVYESEKGRGQGPDCHSCSHPSFTILFTNIGLDCPSDWALWEAIFWLVWPYRSLASPAVCRKACVSSFPACPPPPMVGFRHLFCQCLLLLFLLPSPELGFAF
jgi:hypothetical protein